MTEGSKPMEREETPAMRTHFSPAPLVELRDITVPSSARDRIKPPGFWYSVDGGWEEWCALEQPNWIAGKVCHVVDLGDANILTLSTAAEVRAFSERYRSRDGRWGLDWPRVAESYDGVEVAPYQWSCRLDQRCPWYYGWDCASGVVWNASKMRVRPAENARRAKEKPHA